MSIFSRMSDIVNSNINSLLDKAEDPEKMVKLIIQEMEETLVEVRTTSARAIADKKELQRRADWLSSEANEWARKVEVSIRKGRDDLAKAALQEQNRTNEATSSVEDEIELLTGTMSKLGHDISALQEKIKDAKLRQNAIVLRGKAAQSRLGVKQQLHSSSLDDAMLRFEAYEQKMDRLEGQIESYDLGQRTLSDEIQDLEGDEELEEQLAAIKAEISDSSDKKDKIISNNNQ
ncbi:MAG: phage shock protein PspA [Pseudomonadales bacterium]|nr:phage shock protein PspA [Pseudomonadales bacterium]